MFIGTGVSGGEEGARFGPSMMPGGSVAAWPLVKDIFQAICAKTPEGEACCEWVGRDGAGHFVKMVHNGIEYGDMQLICEAYQLMKEGLGLSNEEMHAVFTEWNKGELDSYLIEITRDILGYKDPETGEAVVDKILDTAGQKGTGKWTSESSLDLGIPVTLIGEAVYARCLSAMKEDRVAASKILSGPKVKFDGDRKGYIKDVIARCQPSWRRVVAKAVETGVAVPAFMTAIAFFDGYRSERLPANLLQAQRDYFGAHTYERVDQPRGKFFHTNWTGKGGNVSAGTYTV